MRRAWFTIGALLAVAWVAPLHGQGSIRGRVTDGTTRQPLVGARVSLGDRGTLTRNDGQFVLTGVPAGTDSLRVRLVGYAPMARRVTVTAGQEVTADFQLEPQAVTLSELVATGYGEQRIGDITGTVSTISAEEFNTGRVVSPAELIASKAPGVQVIDNNEPGGGLTIRIRGATSVNASSDPLYVIDGMPLATGSGSSVGSGGLSAGRDPLNFINPDDIETITVLRDASAAAIYGANAANGVVLITTKSRSGRRGVTGTQFDYTSSFSSSSVTRVPTMLNAAQFREAVETYAPQNADQLLDSNTDWLDQVTQTAFGQDHNLSVSNANENMFYRLSAGYLNQDGVVQGTTVERFSLGVAYQQRLLDDRLDLRVNARGARSYDQFTPGGVLSNAAQMGPTQPIYDESTPTGYYDWSGGLQSPDNPVAILDLATDRGTTYRSVGNVHAAYRMPFLEALRANVALGYDVTKAQRAQFTPSSLHGQYKTGTNGTEYRADPNALNTVMDLFLNYNSPVAGLPGTFDATAGYSYSTSYAENPWFQATGLSTDVLGGNGVTSAEVVQNGMDVQESKLISFFGRLNYNVSDKYLAAFSVRRDGSSRFGEDNAWGVFPSASVGWRLSEESFLRDNESISELKLRASWARTGNQAFANYQQYSTYRFGDAQSQVQFGDVFVSTLRPSAVDPNIKWEETTAYNFGLDFGFMDNRVSGSVDYYTKDTDDLIFTVPVAAGTNLSNYVTTNIGSMRNTGVELNLNLRLLEGGQNRLGWSTTFNISHNANELTNISGSVEEILVGSVSGGVGTTIQVLQPGVPINSFYVYEHIMEDGKPIYADTDGSGTIDEQDLYVDQNGDGVINVADRRAYKDPAPDWILGLSSYMSRGNWDLNFTLRAYLGNYVYNNVASNLGTYAEVTRGSPYNLHSSVLETNFETPQYLSDYYVEDGSFLRMDNITLGYSFDWAGRPMRFTGTVQNAFTLTGYSGVDPTAGLNGIDNNMYPRSRTFSAGLSWRF